MNPAPTLRIAMWSGPRNISTAMMRSFGNRDDCIVCDEPLYANYLASTGLDHPMRDEVLSHHETDWRQVVEGLLAPLPDNKRIYYQKHMAHHLLPEIDRGWLAEVRNCFLIRDPREMLASLSIKLPNVSLTDTGLPQQVEMFHQQQAAGETKSIVLDARDVLTKPHEMLGQLCRALGMDFQPSMLKWPSGRRKTDGVWASHWYHAVEQSTSFQTYQPKNESLPDSMASLLSDCMRCYEQLYPHRLMPES